MPDAWAGYDAWKTTDRIAEAREAAHDAFVSWAEREGLDPDSEEAAEQYEDHCEAQAERIAENRAERRADAEEDRMMERGEW